MLSSLFVGDDLPQCLMAPVQQAGNRPLAAPQPSCDLHEWHSHQVAQDDRVALIVRQPLDGLRQARRGTPGRGRSGVPFSGGSLTEKLLRY
jgi:hypothetical protein